MPTTRSLWQILVHLTSPQQTESMTCDECFMVLEYFAEKAIAGTSPQTLLQLIQKHIDLCPDCWAHHQDRLRQLEGTMEQTAKM